MALYVVGFGPGNAEGMTAEAAAALEKAEVIAAYSSYAQLLKPALGEKEWIISGMKGEKQRCEAAVRSALSGKETAVISSGDAGVYGMAGLVLELCREHPELEVRVISGVSAMCSGAALLGAPLMHDFAVISLSDLLTPYELIMRRVEAAAAAEFVICIYNPSSRKRSEYLKNACDIILKYRDAKTVCGVVRNIGRSGEDSRIMTLGEVGGFQADMFTTVFIGTADTVEINGRMVTKRGYKI